MFSVVPSVCLSRFTPLTVWTLDTTAALLASQTKTGLKNYPLRVEVPKPQQLPNFKS